MWRETLRVLVLAGLCLLVACQPGRLDLPKATIQPATAADDQSEAEAALITFFDLLQTGRYTEAAEYYGGSYESLARWNPAVDASDHAELLRNGCTVNGLQCLQPRAVTQMESTPTGEYTFLVEFETTGGDLFVLGPCCGADETEQPPVSQWSFHVLKNNAGRYLVMDLPPYAP
jgi:hypothetical protein